MSEFKEHDRVEWTVGSDVTGTVVTSLGSTVIVRLDHHTANIRLDGLLVGGFSQVGFHHSVLRLHRPKKVEQFLEEEGITVGQVRVKVGYGSGEKVALFSCRRGTAMFVDDDGDVTSSDWDYFLAMDIAEDPHRDLLAS